MTSYRQKGCYSLVLGSVLNHLKLSYTFNSHFYLNASNSHFASMVHACVAHH